MKLQDDLDEDLTVSYDAYQRATLGTEVCFELHAGLLYLPWYQVVECTEQGR